MPDNERDDFWKDCDLIHSDPEIVSGAPVLKDTRLTPETLGENVEAFIELRGMTDAEAVEATLKQFPGTPGGAKTIRQLIAYQQAHLHQLQP